MQTHQLLYTLVGINSFFSLATIMMHDLFGIPKLGSPIHYMKSGKIMPACSNLATFFFNTPNISGLSLLCGCLTSLTPILRKILCMLVEGPIRRIFASVHLITFLCSLNTRSSLYSWSSNRPLATITSNCSSSPRYAYFRWSWRGFNSSFGG